ncbi:MAG TPA: PilC/PilY family type IV pilus protein, partial [Candidatus Sulfotelmatobacter sp.]|nr:PilC/PilY family type IV pilus protein [Candidatus Sulfotelmatobacter sp.]
STPVLVPPPFLASPDSTYATFKTTYASRETVLLAGANDGMLHAFRESDGTERWAFIPQDLLPYLKQLTVIGGGHQWFVDGSPVVADVKVQMSSAYVTDAAPTWRTIVVVGERRGGKNYYALDITQETAGTVTPPTLLWSFTDPDLGETYSTPTIGKVQMSDGSTKYVVFVAGGYVESADNSLGKAVFAIDIATGTKLWEYNNATGSTDDRKYMNFSIPADVTAVDYNSDGFIDRVYVGDVGGQVWKFDVMGRDSSGNPTGATLSSGKVTNWLGKRLFTADATGDNPPNNPPAAGEYYPKQGIWDAIIPAYDIKANRWIYFGTGDRDHPDNPNAVPNRFYGIIDPVDISLATDMANGSALSEANLVDITSNNGTPIQGWYMQLTGANERVLSSANVFNSIVYFSSFTPTTATTCGAGGGNANLYAVQMVTGYAAVNWANSGVPLTSSSASQTRSTQIGSGIPSKPVIIVTDSGTSVSASVITATTSQQMANDPTPAPSTMRKTVYWKEVF